jgi:hypothetical protein
MESIAEAQIDFNVSHGSAGARHVRAEPDFRIVQIRRCLAKDVVARVVQFWRKHGVQVPAIGRV